ncbi:MAG: hypothetical protein J5I93_10945 [Pirellulaceae bacterium]|nr:hypothetical protein [Pirellulaceae bacterium]
MTTSQLTSTAVDAQATRSFTLWALRTIGLRVEPEGEHVFRFLAPEDRRESLNGAGTVRFTFVEPAGVGKPGAIEYVTPAARMFQWLLDQLKTSRQPTLAVPVADVTGVEQLAERLFAAYSLEGGAAVRLGGCDLEPRSLLRLSFRLGAVDDTRTPRLRHLNFLHDGTLLDDESVTQLRLDDLAPAGPELLADQRGLPERFDEWLDACQAAARESLRAEFPDRSAELLATCRVLCNHAAGTLLFDCGGQAIEVPFEGWALPLAHGQQLPPPLTCPATGRQSYHVAATCDGRVTVREALETCGESGKTGLPDQFETCEATGTRALREFLSTCPVSDGRVLTSRLVACPTCRQRVSPGAVSHGHCQACRALQPISKDDPRLAQIFGEYPKLDRWSHWKLSETSSAYVLSAAAWGRRLLVVLQKDSLEVRHLAAAGRWSAAWSEVPLSQRAELLR